MNPDTDNSTPESDRYVVLNIRTLMADRNIRRFGLLDETGPGSEEAAG